MTTEAEPVPSDLAADACICYEIEAPSRAGPNLSDGSYEQDPLCPVHPNLTMARSDREQDRARLERLEDENRRLTAERTALYELFMGRSGGQLGEKFSNLRAALAGVPPVARDDAPSDETAAAPRGGEGTEYGFSLWPDLGADQAMFDLCRALPRLIMPMSPEAWTVFQAGIERSGLTLREVEVTAPPIESPNVLPHVGVVSDKWLAKRAAAPVVPDTPSETT